MGKLQHSHRGVAGGRAPCCPRCSQLGGQAGTSLPAAHRTPLSPNPISARLIASVSDSCWGTKHGFPSLLPQCFAGEHSGRMLPVERESTALHKQPAVQTLALQAPSSVGPRQQRGSAALGSACASTKHLPRCFQSTFGTDVAAGRPGHCSPLHAMSNRQRWSCWQPQRRRRAPAQCWAVGGPAKHSSKRFG